MKRITQHRDLIISVIIVIIASVVYLLTILPETGISGDTAKFQFIGRFLGTPHSTGYPTYILLNHVFTRLFPIGSIAHRANVLSAAFTVVALVVSYRLLRELESDPILSLATTLIFAFTPTLWFHSLFAEVYTLHLLFMVLTIYFFIRWNRTLNTKYLLIGCGIYAFSFGNHLTSIVALPAIFFLVWVTDRGVFKQPKLIAAVLLLILLSLSQYTYFVWRTFDPTTVYLEMHARDLKTLLWFMTGGQFRGGMFAYSLTELITIQIPRTINLFLRNFGILIAFIPFGIIRLRNWKINTFLILIFLGNTFYAINYRIPDIEAYFIPSNLILTIYIGLGLNWIVERLQGRTQLVIKYGTLLFPIFLLVRNFQFVDQSENLAKTNETTAILNAVGKESVIITPDYNTFEFLLYYVIAEGWGDNDIFITNHFDPDGLISYVQGKANLENHLTQQSAPPGWDIYLSGIGDNQRAALEERGFALEELKGGLLYSAVLVEDGISDE